MSDSRFLLIIFLLAIVLILLVLFSVSWLISKENRNRNMELERITLRNDELDEYRSELEKLKTELRSSIQNGAFDSSLAVQSQNLSYQKYTGIPVVDSLLVCKRNRCTDLGIALTVNFAVKPPKYMEEKYIASLICNLLDNAIDAAAKTSVDHMDNTDNSFIPFVNISSRQAKGQWILETINSKDPKDHPLENGMKSTKIISQGHGLGSRIIDKIVSRYSGYIKRTDNVDSFNIFITLPQ